jgi:hypothetical protein
LPLGTESSTRERASIKQGKSFIHSRRNVPMRDSKSLHLKLQEYADCFSETDAAKELEEISEKGAGGDRTGDLTEVALKYLATAILLGIEEEAEKVQITREGAMEGDCRLLGQTEIILPRPPTGLAREMIGIVRCITDLEADTGESRLAYGIRNDQLDIDVSIHKAGEKESLGLGLVRAK